MNTFESGDRYIDKLLERLTKDKIKNIREFNHPLRKNVNAYFKARRKAVSFLKGKSFFERKIRFKFVILAWNTKCE